MPLTGREADAPEAPKSAARLAAEAIFSLPPLEPAFSNATQVVVRKSRAMLPTTAQPATEKAGSVAPKAEAPRVFRLDPARQEPAAPPAARTVATPVPAAPTRLARHQRIAVDKRPGPMLQLFQAAPTPARKTEVEADDAAQAPQLLAELAQLEPVFESIRRAQSLRLMDAQGARQWLRLARDADAIQAQIDEQLRG